jgi:hypothetical protein
VVPPKHDTNPQPRDGNGSINRRTVVGAAAWAAPAIALSVASPASATSLGTITASPKPIKAGTTTSTPLQLNPAADNVTIAVSAAPEGIVTFPATMTTLPGLNGRTSVPFSTTETDAQTVMITAVAPGYAPVTFALPIEATPVIEPEPEPEPEPTLSLITLVEAPEFALFNASTPNRYPLEFALSPAASGVPITLTRERGPQGGLVGIASYDLITDATGRAKTTVGAVESIDDAAIVRASAPGYETLEFVINTLAAGSTVPTDPGSGGVPTWSTHPVTLVSVVGAESLTGYDEYVIGDNPITVTVRVGVPAYGDAYKWPLIEATEGGRGITDAAYPDIVSVSPRAIRVLEGGTTQFTVTKHRNAVSGRVEQVSFGNYATDIMMRFRAK